MILNDCKRVDRMFDYKCDGVGYTIKAGDTLYNISRSYNIPLDLIMKANPNIDVYNLQIGDVVCLPIKIPVSFDNISTYIIKPEDTLESILQNANITYEDLLQYNNLDNVSLQAGMVLIIPNRKEPLSMELDED